MFFLQLLHTALFLATLHRLVSSSVFTQCLAQQGSGLSRASRKQHHNAIKTCSFGNSTTSVNHCELGSDPSNLIHKVQREPVMV